MKKLVIEVFRLGTVVYGSVLEQEGIERGSGELHSLNGYRLTSDGSPTLQRRSLAVRGTSTSADDRAFYYNFDRPEDAAKAEFNIKKLVEDFNRINMEE